MIKGLILGLLALTAVTISPARAQETTETIKMAIDNCVKMPNCVGLVSDHPQVSTTVNMCALAARGDATLQKSCLEVFGKNPKRSLVYVCKRAFLGDAEARPICDGEVFAQLRQHIAKHGLASQASLR